MTIAAAAISIATMVWPVCLGGGRGPRRAAPGCAACRSSIARAARRTASWSPRRPGPGRPSGPSVADGVDHRLGDRRRASRRPAPRTRSQRRRGCRRRPGRAGRRSGRPGASSSATPVVVRAPGCPSRPLIAYPRMPVSWSTSARDRALSPAARIGLARLRTLSSCRLLSVAVIAANTPERAQQHRDGDAERDHPPPQGPGRHAQQAHRPPPREISSIATSSASGPPLPCSARPTSQAGSAASGTLARGRLVEQAAQPVHVEPFVADAGVALDQPVGVHQQGPVIAGELHVGGGGGCGPYAEHDPGTRGHRHGPAAAPAAPAAGGRPAVRSPGWPPGRCTTDGDRGEDLAGPPLAHQHLFERAEHLLLGHPGQHQRPPGHPQLDAERGLVHAVPADVADDHVQPVVADLHDVEEVAAEQAHRPPGAVERVHRDLGGLHQRLGQQAALQAGRLGLAQLHLAQPLGVLVGPLALDRVAQRPDQQHAVDLALDQVVLGALGDRGDARGARRSGRSARRPRRCRPPPAACAGRRCPRRRAGPRSSRTHWTPRIIGRGLAQAAGHHQVERRLGLAEQLPDQEGVALVVLDEQDAQPFRVVRRRLRHRHAGARPTVQSCRYPDSSPPGVTR